MAIFKRKYTRDGERRETANFYIEFTDHCSARRRLAAFESRKLSEAMEARLNELVAFRTSSQIPSAALQSWIDDLLERIVKRLADWDLITTGRYNHNEQSASI